jgi:DNA invertase Pin-like site-specific DNA recombinase
MIVECTQTGKAVARQNPSFQEGRLRNFTAVQIQHAMELLESGKSYKQVEAMTGISKSTLIRARRA